jgi:hypothetical protein
MTFSLSLEDTQSAAKKSKEKASTGRVNYLKLKDQTTGVVLLPSADGKTFIKEMSVHQYYSPAKKQMLVNVSSPEMDGEKDPIKDVGWKYREKYMESDNKKLKDLWKIFMPKDVRSVNVLNVKDFEAGVQVMNMPKIVFDNVTEEILECETQEELDAICHFDKGRVLKIKHNGKTGLFKKYEIAKFLNKPAGLIESGKFDEETLQGMLYDLEKLVPPRDDAKIKEALATLSKIARKIEENETDGAIENDELDEDFSEDEIVEDESSEEDEFDLD